MGKKSDAGEGKQSLSLPVKNTGMSGVTENTKDILGSGKEYLQQT